MLMKECLLSAIVITSAEFAGFLVLKTIQS